MQVTDPALLAQLANASGRVTDPVLLAQLNDTSGHVVYDDERTPGGLYHYIDASGQEVYSKSPPPGGSKPVPASSSGLSANPMENFEAGMGKAFVDTGRGVRQLYAHAADYVDPVHPSLSSLVTGAPVSRSARIQQEIDEAQDLDRPLMHSGAGVTGNIFGYLAALAPFAPETIAGATAMGAAQGALQPVQTGGSRAWNTGVGAVTGAAGQTLGKVLGRIAQPVRNNLSPEQTQQVADLATAGVPLDVGQRTGSPVIKRLISALGDNPATAGKYAASREAQKTAFNRAVLGKFGADADSATPEVMQDIRERIGGVFDDVAARNSIGFDTDLASALQKAKANASLNEAGEKLVDRSIGRLTRATDNSSTIDSDEFMKTYSALGRQTRSPEVGTYATELRDVMRDALQRSAGPDDAQAIDEARSQWQMMRQVEPAITDSGDISVRKLAGALRTARNRAQSVYGYGNQDLVSLARSANSIMPDALGNSGTAARTETAAAPLIHMEALLHAGKGEFGKAAALEAGAFGLPKLASPLLSSGPTSNYLVNGVSNPLVRALLKASASTPSRQLLSQTPQRLVLNASNE